MISEEKKHISEVIKNVVVAMSIAIGGIWAIYTFDARLEAQNARAKLELLNKQLKQRPLLHSKIHVSFLKGETTNQWILKIRVIVENVGNSDTEIEVLEESVRVARVEMKEGVVSGFKNPIYLEQRSIPNKEELEKPYRRTATLSMLSGQSQELIYLASVSVPGLYQIEFRAGVGKSARELRNSIAEFYPGERNMFGRHEIVYIGEGSNEQE
jgi:hypothetical protein